MSVKWLAVFIEPSAEDGTALCAGGDLTTRIFLPCRLFARLLQYDLKTNIFRGIFVCL